MANFYARTVFFVTDVEQSLRFYTEILGFRLDWDSHDGELQVSLFGAEVILNEVGSRTRTRAGQGLIFIGFAQRQPHRYV